MLHYNDGRLNQYVFMWLNTLLAEIPWEEIQPEIREQEQLENLISAYSKSA
jgi:hypothetical protein